MALPPFMLARLLAAATALAETEQADIASQHIAFKLRRRVQPNGPVRGTGVAKLVQYDGSSLIRVGSNEFTLAA